MKVFDFVLSGKMDDEDKIERVWVDKYGDNYCFYLLVFKVYFVLYKVLCWKIERFLKFLSRDILRIEVL